MRFYHMDLKFTMYKKEYIKNWFVKLREYGFDGVVIEIDNKLIFPSHPGFAAKDALGPDEWNEIVRFAIKTGLMVYPLLQTLGHMEHVLRCGDKYTYLAENCDNIYMLCPSKESTFNFIKDLISDLVSIFDNPARIHLGGDEVYSHLDKFGIIKCPACSKKESSGLLIGYLIKLAGFCIDKGVCPEFWADNVLAYPEYIDEFPKQTRFVDWYYTRINKYSQTIGNIWGIKVSCDKPLNFLKELLPENLQCMIPFMDAGNNRFNNFYGAHFLKNKGYEITVASGVRSCGDNYAVPRIGLSSKNVGLTEQVSKELRCDHLITSWAVRLSHPETTLPALDSANNENWENVCGSTKSLGYIGKNELALLSEIEKGVKDIDKIYDDHALYEIPYYNKYTGAIKSILKSGNMNEVEEMYKRRLDSAKKAIPLFKSRLDEKKGDMDCLEHLIDGIKLCSLRSKQMLAVIDSYKNGLDRKYIQRLISENEELMEEFEKLWRRSVTVHSLEREKEIKFKKDIRILKNLINN